MTEIWPPDPDAARLLRPAAVKGGAPYRWSRFAIAFEAAGGRYLFNTLTRQCVRSRLSPGSSLFDGKAVAEDGELAALAAGRFLVPEDADECALYEGVIRILRAPGMDKGPAAYTLLTTLACNARCVYCYEEGMKPVTMTEAAADGAAEYILRTRRRDRALRLIWFGGEPLLRPDITDRICQRLRQEGADFCSSVTTNGSLLTEDLAAKMAEEWKLSDIQFSMDCGEDEYISRKRYADYRDYYNAVPGYVRLFTERGVRVRIRCNADRLTAPRIPELLEHLSRCIKEKKGVTVYFTPLIGERAEQDSRETWDSIAAADGLIEAAGFRTSDDTGRRLKRFFCKADDQAANRVIAPDGRLYPCERCLPGTSFGSIWEGITDRALYSRYADLQPVREKCRGCSMLPECTPFRMCPIADYDCKGMRELLLVRALKKEIANAAKTVKKGE